MTRSCMKGIWKEKKKKKETLTDTKNRFVVARGRGLRGEMEEEKEPFSEKCLSKKRGYMFMYPIADSLCSTIDTNTTLSNNYTPIKILKIKI